jgi:hypothetical protein
LSDRIETVEVLRTLAAEDLVATKILAGRPKDIDDVAGILRERLSRLDLERVRATPGLIEEALGQSDLVPQLDALLARARR